MDHIAGVISDFAKFDLIIQHLTSNVRESKQPRESIFLLNLMISQGSKVGERELFDLTEIYLDFELVSSPKTISLRGNGSQNMEDVEKNEIEWSMKLLILDGLACVIKALSFHGTEVLR